MFVFIQKWRRRRGVPALVFALAVMVFWVRSEYLIDAVTFDYRNRNYSLGSGYGMIAFQISWIPSASSTTTSIWQSLDWSLGYPAGNLIDDSPFYEMNWRWNHLGFDFWDGRGKKEVLFANVARRNIPYWALGIPLTILAGYLLLSKPRAPKSEPTPSSNHLKS